MQTALVGYTGFVGSNLTDSYEFDGLYNTKNIETAYGTKPDLLIYAGVRAEKFIANHDPEQDLQRIQEAFTNIKRIQPQRIVLISTVDVYRTPVKVDEETPVLIQDLQPYGANRYLLEELVRNEFQEVSVVRLPGLFGSNIKKNFIFDYLNVIPSMLNDERFKELALKESLLAEYYVRWENGFYRCKPLTIEARQELKQIFANLEFSALNFTDSRSIFQFYPLKRLWNDIEIVLKNKLPIWNAATEPVSAREVYQYLTGKDFMNELDATPAYYNYYTKYAKLFGENRNYILDKDGVLSEIKKFVEMREADEAVNL